MKASRWLILIYLVFWGSVVRPAFAADLYQGTVVDEETGQPLAGAVVAVTWFRSLVVSLGGSKDFQSVQEAVADGDGKFSLVVSPGIDWNPFTYIRKEPDIVIFQPGYEPTTASWRVRNGLADDKFPEALKKGATIKLQKLKTREQMIKFTSVGSLVHTRVPHENIPKLMQAINVQSKMVGIPPYPEQGGITP